jgi:FtsP/CotA-like multicopper oxidase with cupredoxin domain
MGVRRHRNPGRLLRATAGDELRVEVDNQLPAARSVHWHGLACANDMDGVPGITQDPIPAGGSFRDEFTVPDPGTYFYHPHSGVQLDRGLYGVLVVDDPVEQDDTTRSGSSSTTGSTAPAAPRTRSSPTCRKPEATDPWVAWRGWAMAR